MSVMNNKIFLVKEENLEGSIKAYKEWIDDYKRNNKKEPSLEEMFRFVHDKDANREIKVELSPEEIELLKHILNDNSEYRGETKERKELLKKLEGLK